jgi:hypothetical protein
MRKSAQKRTNIVAFLSTVVVSAGSMLWLFWHHPVSTGIATLLVLGALGVSARMARWIDTDPLSSDLDRGEQSA